MKPSNQLAAVIMIFSALFYFSFTYVVSTEWEVPAKYKKMENPVEMDSEGKMIAKQLYSKHCKSCHGKTGLGDGPKAAELDTPSGDFSSAEFQGQSDGELYYKTTFGRDDMPAYDKKIPEDEDRWLIVHYMRTFAK